MNTTVVIGSLTASYGRHAAPPSAYGPADFHRLHPAPRIDSRQVQPDDAESAQVDQADSAVVAFDVAAVDHRGAALSSDDASEKPTSLWRRLRRLPKAV